MKSRWQKSLEAAVAAYDTPMPWERGDIRQAMIARREARAEEARETQAADARRAWAFADTRRHARPALVHVVVKE